MIKKLKIFVLCLLCGGFIHLSAQSISTSLGTDFPYQLYAGISIDINRTDVYYFTGILTRPYSDILLNVAENLGAGEVYINLLGKVYDFGWMNGLGSFINLDKASKWKVGPEFRVDYLTGSDVPAELIEVIVGRSIQVGSRLNRTNEASLGLLLYGGGLRGRRTFILSENSKHRINIDITASKYFSTKTFLRINDYQMETLGKELNELLWNDVFKKYGFVGGIGFSYTYLF